jgi:putative DNA primase/helicase
VPYRTNKTNPSRSSASKNTKHIKWGRPRAFADLKRVLPPRPWLVGGPVQEGRRNTYLTSFAGKLRRKGVSNEALSAALIAENRVQCSPPLDVREVETIIASANRYTGITIPEGIDAAEGLMLLVLDRYFHGGKHLLFSTDGQFWHFDVRLWRAVPEEWISGKILKTIASNPIKNRKTASTASLIHQVLALLKARLAVKDDVMKFATEPPPVINCRNGELWIAKDGGVKLRPHGPKSHLRNCLEIAYEPDAGCPIYDKAVREIFGQAEDPEAMVRHWNELMGYVLQPRRNIPIIAVLRGAGDNGKTKLVGTLSRLLGDRLVNAQRVENLDRNRFAIGSLFGKLLFVDDDVRAGARLPDGTLKIISEAKEITGELKFLPAFNFVVRAIPFLLCNHVPSLADLSYGMRRRLMVIPFDRRFTDENRDPTLFDPIWADELPGVLNRALAGYQRVLKRGMKFDLPAAVVAATNLLLQQANPLPAFIEAMCTKKTASKCLVRNLYVVYCAWTRRMGFTLTQSQPEFTRNLEHLGFATSQMKRGFFVIGLALKGKCS